MKHGPACNLRAAAYTSIGSGGGSDESETGLQPEGCCLHPRRQKWPYQEAWTGLQPEGCCLHFYRDGSGYNLSYRLACSLRAAAYTHKTEVAIPGGMDWPAA